MSSPAVTVVMPLYQKAGSVLAAVRSVLCQRFVDLELLVVDDGSTDDGPALVARLVGSRLRLVRQPNQGPGVARNRGLAEARGALMHFWTPTTSGGRSSSSSVSRPSPPRRSALPGSPAGRKVRRAARRWPGTGAWDCP